MPSSALWMLMVVMLNEPLWVVGMPLYMNCTLFALVMVREALRSIFRSRTGSRVAFSCRSSDVLLVEGVAVLSVMSSHSLSMAFCR